MQRIELDIQGMTCASCSSRVESALCKLPGVEQAPVNLATERASVSYDEQQLDTATVLQQIEKIGYTPVTAELEIGVGGMTCANCSARVERTLEALPGVLKVNVNLATERAQLQYLPAMLSADDVATSINNSGYEAKPLLAAAQQQDQQQHERSQRRKALKRDVVLALALSLPVFVLAMGSHFIPAFHHALLALAPQPWWDWTQALLTTAVIIGPGRRFYKPGWIAWRHASPDMNSLVMTGTAAAWGYSLLVLVAPSLFPIEARHVYFESAAVVLSVILIGKYLEEIAKGRTSAAIQKLLGLQAKTAHRLSDGKEQDVAISSLQIGDVILIKPAERIPLDAEIIDGDSYVDESMISGEAIPVSRSIGDSVIGGTLNQHGVLKARVSRVGKDTVLAQIIALVERAQGSKLPIQGLADRVVRVFTPTVIAIALLSFMAWMLLGPDPAINLALVSAVAVLVVACPCAMGLATPAAIMVGSGRAAELGVLFRRGEALEALAHVDTVVFDKTGTLTEGRPQLTDEIMHPEHSLSEAQLLSLVAAVEANSEHPLAQALVDAAAERQLRLPEVSNFKVLPGYGVEALVANQSVLIGAQRLLSERHIETSNLQRQAQNLAEQGKTPIFVALEHQLLAILAISDPLKAQAAALVSKLKQESIAVVMISGDAEATVRAVAKQAGIERFHAETLPQHKAELVQQLKAQNLKVAFVGDGINDAPALVEAQVGIALGSGTDIAIEAADVTLTSHQLGGVYNAINLARRSMNTIRANLFWAFFYNILLIPLATGLFIPRWGWSLNPMLAGLAMGMSSVFVVANSLRLRHVAAIHLADASLPHTTLAQSHENQSSIAATNPAIESNQPQAQEYSTMSTTIKVEGMSCMHCVGAVKKALEAVAGVDAVEVTLEPGQAVVTGQASAEELVSVIKAAGYEAEAA